MSYDTYTCEDIICPKCKKKRIVSFVAPGLPAARRIVSELCQELCSVCNGSYTPRHVIIDETNRVPEYKEPRVYVEDGRKQRLATVEEIKALDAKVRHIKWENIIQDGRFGYKYFGITINDAPKYEHHFSCKCPQCELTKLLIHEHRTGIYETVLKQI
jgi:hypothetical protein